MDIYKIVITGGPCAGKSTAMSWIQNAFTERGYTVLFVPETATELISGGVAPWTCGTNLDYQKGQVKLQDFKEKIFEECAKTMKAKKILLVCDRGQLDNRAYMTEDEFIECLKVINSTPEKARDNYDAVFHLVTAAKGAEKFYTQANNAIRYESVENAIKVDDGLIAAWTGHPHYRIIDNSYDFEDKMRRLIFEISSFLGEAPPYIQGRKFLIEYPTKEVLASIKNAKSLDIVQTYLKKIDDIQYRVRERCENGHYTYYIKKKNESRGVELEKRLSKMEYNELLSQADPTRKAIKKKRICFVAEDQYNEIDLFDFWTEYAILEVKVGSLEHEVKIPSCFKVIKEVTGVKEYRNSELSKIK